MSEAAEVDQVSDLIQAHRAQMDALLKAHTERLEQAQADFDGLVVQAHKQLQSLINQGKQAEEPKPQIPEAVWSNGYLVLNRPAALMVQELLSRTGEVLSEVGKLVSTKPRGAR